MSFDTLAPCYRAMERVLAGELLQRSRVAFLAETSGAKQALLLGEGPGRFLPALLAANSVVMVTCVEKSVRMIEAARAGLSDEQLKRVRFENVDALRLMSAPETFDLIVTNFFLDCFCREELAALIARISRTAQSKANWLVTDFCEPQRGWQRWRGRLVLAAMYAFFRVTTEISARQLTAPDEFLQAGGFDLVRRQRANFGLIHADLWHRRTS